MTGLKILMVEPHADIRYLMEEFVRRKITGIEVTTAGNVEAAATKLRADGFDGLVIGSVGGRAALDLSSLARREQPQAFIILFSPNPETAQPDSAEATIIRQPNFPQLVEKIGELIGQAQGRTARCR